MRLRLDRSPACLLCGKERPFLYTGLRDRHFSAPGEWSMRHCVDCGLLWLDPRPHVDEVQNLYAGYYTHDAANGSPAKVRNTLKEDFGLAGIEPGRLLELGCGDGAALKAMADLGWDVTGIEPDREAAARAASRGLRVVAAPLEDAGLPGSHFDVIVIRNAFHYVSSPIQTLAECRRLLQKGGLLAMNVPNLSSAGHRWFGKDWVMLDPPREHFVYSAGAIRACLQKAGLSVRSLRATPRLSSSIWIFSSAIRRHGRLAGYSVAGRDAILQLPAALLFQALETVRSLFIEAGEDLIIVAEKGSA